jgi:hypothetical protein
MALLPDCSSDKECCLKTSSPTLDGARHLLKQHAEELARQGDRFVILMGHLNDSQERSN